MDTNRTEFDRQSVIKPGVFVAALATEYYMRTRDVM